MPVKDNKGKTKLEIWGPPREASKKAKKESKPRTRPSKSEDLPKW